MSIMIVEDNPISMRAVEMILNSNGFETVSAKTGRHALELLAGREDVQVILSDLMMPEMDGYQLLEELGKHETWSKIPVVVMTSISDADTVRKVVSRGCKHYLVKPVREEALMPKLRQALSETTAPSDPPLKPKFKVLEDNGMDPAKYEDLFDTFHADVHESVALLAAGIPPPLEAAKTVLLRMREGASLLASSRLQALLGALKTKGACDWNLLAETLDALSKAMQAAVERRERMKMKLARQAGGEA